MDHLENNHLISDRQFGFRRNRSTEQATAIFTDQIRKNMDKGQLTGAVFIDMSKAFDTISHASIINKLPSYGISGAEYQWLISYLFGRKQQVSFLGTTSSLYPIYCGVPQGSILGPLLFILHFNDAVETLLHCGIVMYADDTVIFCADKNTDVIQKRVEEDFSSLSDWLAENELIINCKKGKTEVMMFGTSQRLNKTDNSTLQLYHNSTPIAATQTYKYLGLTLTSSLNMSQHLAAAIKKASSRVHLLRKMRSFMDAKTTKLIYQAMIVPILTYGSLSLYGSTPPHIKSKIEKVEDRAQLIIGNSETIPKAESIKRKQLCTFVHKCLHNDDICSELKEYYTIRKTTANTRCNGTKLDIPKIKLEAARKSTYYQGAIVFNELPEDTRKETNYRTFKKQLN